jgi:hypothetical protein
MEAAACKQAISWILWGWLAALDDVRNCSDGPPALEKQ